MEHSIHPETHIGHVHLRVSDLDRAVKFYTDVLGFQVSATYGPGAAFLAAGGYHHHIGLNTWESLGGKPPAPGTTGLYHFAILVPSRRELALHLDRLRQHRWPLDGAADHGVSEALYLRDPDQNGIEIYRDRPRAEWPKGPGGELVMYTHALDLGNLLAELS